MEEENITPLCDEYWKLCSLLINKDSLKFAWFFSAKCPRVPICHRYVINWKFTFQWVSCSQAVSQSSFRGTDCRPLMAGFPTPSGKSDDVTYFSFNRWLGLKKKKLFVSYFMLQKRLDPRPGIFFFLSLFFRTSDLTGVIAEIKLTDLNYNNQHLIASILFHLTSNKLWKHLLLSTHKPLQLPTVNPYFYIC